jgi:predicted Na+-dependent transporter
MSEERIEPEPGFWEWSAAVACFLVGVLALAIGFVLTTDRLLDGHLHPSLHALGIVLLIIGIPVIILGGHFMDLEEKKTHTPF